MHLSSFSCFAMRNVAIWYTFKTVYETYLHGQDIKERGFLTRNQCSVLKFLEASPYEFIKAIVSFFMGLKAPRWTSVCNCCENGCHLKQDARGSEWWVGGQFMTIFIILLTLFDSLFFGSRIKPIKYEIQPTHPKQNQVGSGF